MKIILVIIVVVVVIILGIVLGTIRLFRDSRRLKLADILVKDAKYSEALKIYLNMIRSIGICEKSDKIMEEKFLPALRMSGLKKEIQIVALKNLYSSHVEYYAAKKTAIKSKDLKMTKELEEIDKLDKELKARFDKEIVPLIFSLNDRSSYH